MSNRLSMSKIHSIETLHQSGHSNREIARLLSVDRGTVNAYVRRLKSQNLPDLQAGATDFAAASFRECPVTHPRHSTLGILVICIDCSGFSADNGHG